METNQSDSTDSTGLSKERRVAITKEAHRGREIANSTSGHPPLPVIEKTIDESKQFLLKCSDKFYYHPRGR